LSADELDLIDAWFAGGTLPQGMGGAGTAASAPAAPAQAPAAHAPQPAPEGRASSRWWSLDDGRSHLMEQRAAGRNPDPAQGEEFPRIVRTRLRG
jgi:hypothetical protein